MFCPNCKHYAGKGHEFCSKCGAFVPAEDSDTFRYASFDISGADNQRVAARKPDGIERIETARESAGTVGRTGKYTQNEAPANRQGTVSIHPAQTPPHTGLPPYTGIPVSRPSASGQTKKATGCAPVVIISVIVIGMIIIFPQIMRISDPGEVYDDQTVPVSATVIYADISPDETENVYEIDTIELWDVVIETNGEVSSFVLTPLHITPLSGRVLPKNIELKGVMLFLDGSELDVRFDGETVHIDDCALETETRYDVQHIRLESTDGETYYFILPEEERGITF